MDGRDWRIRLATRYMRAFENGDIAEIDAVLGPNFHELIEGRDEIDRLGQVDHLGRLIEASSNRCAELVNFSALGDDLRATLKLQFDIGRQTWMVEGQLLFRFDGQTIDHVTVFAADVRSLEPMRQTRAG